MYALYAFSTDSPGMETEGGGGDGTQNKESQTNQPKHHNWNLKSIPSFIGF